MDKIKISKPRIRVVKKIFGPSKGRIRIKKIRDAFGRLIKFFIGKRKSVIRIKKPVKNETVTTSGNITIHSTEKHCPACTCPIEPGEPTAKCQANPAHVVHQRCVELVQGKCPYCKHPLERN